jgi:hypothetical protein
MVGSLVLRQSHFYRGIGIGQDQDQGVASSFYLNETASDDLSGDLADRGAVRVVFIKQ